MNGLLASTNTRNKTKAIELAIKDYLERKSVEDLISLSGKLHVDLEWQKEEEDELDEYRDNS